MPLSFPNYDHLPLKNPPLKEVICQIRFPAIFKITTEIPADFHEAIRNRFPKSYVERGFKIEFPADFSDPKGEGAIPPTYRFQDRSETSQISLTHDFFAVDTKGYQGWQAFAADLRLASEAMFKYYQIPYVTRIGLRYLNQLKTSNTGLSDFSAVLDLLRPELTAALQTQAITDSISQMSIRAEHEDSIFSFRSGITKDESGERAFNLDFDLYTEGEIEVISEDILARCDDYHRIIYNAFRWSLHESFNIDSIFNRET